MPLLDSLHKRKRPNLLVLLSCSWKCSAHAQKTRNRSSFAEFSGREHHIHKKHLQRKGDMSKHLGKHTMRSGLSLLLMRKVTLAWTLKFAVLLWKDWTGRQSSVIGKQHSQLHRIGKGGAQCRMPCDFPLKSGSWIYCINVGIRLLMCSRKLYCVPYFGDFCSWKHNFGVGKYAVGFLPWEIWVAFPRGKPAATVALPNLQCVLGVLVFPWSTELWHGLWDL